MINNYLLIGSASSGNPAVKVAILKSSFFNSLIAKLSNQKDLKLNLKTIYAISSVIRQFPLAQKQFIIDQQGLKLFKQFFNDSLIEMNRSSKNLTNLIKIQTKIISLLSDLKEEHRFTAVELLNLKKSNITQLNELSNLEEKMKQYNQVSLEQRFVEEGFCLILPKNLNSSSYDVKERTLKGMYSFRGECKDQFKDQLIDLLKIKDELNSRIEKDRFTNPNDSDDYYLNLIELTKKLIDYLGI